MGTATMGRPKKVRPEGSPPKPKPKPLLVQMEPEFWAWVSEFADSMGLSKAELVELALVELARKRRYPKPAPPRIME